MMQRDHTLAPPLDDTPLARRVLDALPQTIYSVDLDGRITAANNTWSRFAADNGAAELALESAVIGSSIFDRLGDEASREQIERAMTLPREDRVPMVRWEFPCTSPDEERIFLMQISALRGADGLVDGFVFSTVDITPSHRSREALIDTGIALSRRHRPRARLRGSRMPGAPRRAEHRRRHRASPTTTRQPSASRTAGVTRMAARPRRWSRD